MGPTDQLLPDSGIENKGASYAQRPTYGVQPWPSYGYSYKDDYDNNTHEMRERVIKRGTLCAPGAARSAIGNQKRCIPAARCTGTLLTELVPAHIKLT